MQRRRIIVLGSTGSIGVNTLAVVEHLRREGEFYFEVVGLATGSNAQAIADQARTHGVRSVAVANAQKASTVDWSAAGVRDVLTGPDAALHLVESCARAGDIVVGAMVGSAGIPATLAAIESGCDIALANKETLVAAGELVMPLVRAKGVHLLPVDSEHSAIFQCLQNGRSIDEVQRLVITASGGPFRTWSAERTAAASVAEALNHPTWRMGPKVTIDSATMMNKALEVIEAHWLFGLDASAIDVIVHPQSLVHSFVEFIDGSVLAQLGPPDMRTPIQYALTWPHRAPGCSRCMDWASLRSMEFEPVDHDRFPAVNMARRVVTEGGTMGATFNAANEVAVAAFLEGRLAFGDIARLVGECLQARPSQPIRTLDDVLRADRAAREFTQRAAAAQVSETASR